MQELFQSCTLPLFIEGAKLVTMVSKIILLVFRCGMFVLLSVGSEHEHQLVCFLEMTSFAGIVPIMYITIIHRRCQVGNHGIKKMDCVGPRIAEYIVCALWMASKEFLLLCHSCIQNITVQILVLNPCNLLG